MFIPFIPFILLLPKVFGQTKDPHEGIKVMQVKLDGDVIVGGLFPMHEDGSSMGVHCGAIKMDKGVQRMEAMMYAIRQINQNHQRDRILPEGFNLGAHILDTCSQDTHALEQSLEFIKNARSPSNADQFVCANSETPIQQKFSTLVGVIGAASSQVSVMVANMLRLFKPVVNQYTCIDSAVRFQIPQISYSSTSAQLSDKSRFEYFSRVVPSDAGQSQAMAALVAQLNFSLVAGVYDSGSYGEEGFESFKKFASEKGVCTGLEQKIKRNFQDADFDVLVDNLLDDTKNEARAVVFYSNEDNIKKTLLAAQKKHPRKLYWIASDSWGTKREPINGPQRHEACGAITVQPKLNTNPGFDNYFTNLTPENHDKEMNPWFEDFWRVKFNCSNLDILTCPGSLALNHSQESYVPFVIDAVHTLAHALRKYMDEKCLKYNVSLKNCDFRNGSDLLEYIRKVSFVGPQGTVIELNTTTGDRIGEYDLFVFDQKFNYLKIGDFENKTLNVSLKLVGSVYKALNREFPKSVCGVDCKPNESKRYSTDGCCWVCIYCDDTSILPNETSCIPCDLGYLPDPTKSICIQMMPETMEWLSPYSLLPMSFSIIGICCTILVIYAFVRFNKTPIIMASGRELCYFMISGILMGYLMTFVLLHRPTAISCGVTRVGLGLCMNAIYAAIITKTSRLARVFTSNIRSAKRPRFITPRAQCVICACIVSVQFCGACVWLVIDPPQTTVIYPSRMEAVLSCSVTATPLLLSLVYNMVLIMLCTFYAVKTRKIPENFNETKYIGFTMYATCIVWLAFIPIYFATHHNFRIQLTSLCMSTSISGSVALFCFFSPKVYIVFFQPNKNVRASNLTGFQKLLQNQISQQMRFVNHMAPETPKTLEIPYSDEAKKPRLLKKPNPPESQMTFSVLSTVSVDAKSEGIPQSELSLPHVQLHRRITAPDFTDIQKHEAKLNMGDLANSTPLKSLSSTKLNQVSCITNTTLLKEPCVSPPLEFELNETTPFLQEEAEPDLSPNSLSISFDDLTNSEMLSPWSPAKETWVVTDARAEVELILNEITESTATFV